MPFCNGAGGSSVRAAGPIDFSPLSRVQKDLPPSPAEQMMIPGPPRCQTGSQQARLAAGVALGVAVTHGTRSLPFPAPGSRPHHTRRRPIIPSHKNLPEGRNHTQRAESEPPDEAATAPTISSLWPLAGREQTQQSGGDRAGRVLGSATACLAHFRTPATPQPPACRSGDATAIQVSDGPTPPAPSLCRAEFHPQRLSPGPCHRMTDTHRVLCWNVACNHSYRIQKRSGQTSSLVCLGRV